MLADLQEFAPPTLLALGSRINVDVIASGLERSLADLEREAGVEDRPRARRTRARQRAAAVTSSNGSGH